MTLETLAAQIAGGFKSISERVDASDDRMERGFSAVAGDITDIKHDIGGLKDGIARMSEQVTSIESQLRGMNYGRLESRVEDLEDKVFGKSRV